MRIADTNIGGFMVTPWAPYRTPRPTMFFCVATTIGLMVLSGDNPNRLSSCRFDSQKKIGVLLPDAREWQDVEPYRLPLDRWRHAPRVPRIRLHPFALMHLLATNQVPRREVMRMVSIIGPGSPCASFPVSCPCELRTMLGGVNFTLEFATNCDLEVDVR